MTTLLDLQTSSFQNTMVKAKRPKTSNAVREEGTKLYKDGNLQEGI
jgi:hypothetical protein